ncbi:MAG: undecaprenyl-diphosphate phosphatase [Deltaproteobacteria bacterium]|nr:undecaprenyl-diphosphate phosphatase [Deltaproteobacteria bacterium]
MTTIETIFLGIIQGLTEFLPVSSSGHLVVCKNLLGFKAPELLLDTSLHFGTLLAVCVYFRSVLRQMIKEIWQRVPGREDRRSGFGPHAVLALMVVIGSIPTALIGIIFKDPLERLFGSVTTVGVMLVITGLIVGVTRFIPKAYGKRDQVSPLIALAIGAAQGMAIMPGISRSGATIVCALLFGLNRELAGRFSFILSIPAIIGALVLQLDMAAITRMGAVPLILGFLSSAFVGFVALKLLMGMVKKGHFYYFAPYCWAIGILTVLFA